MKLNKILLLLISISTTITCSINGFFILQNTNELNILNQEHFKQLYIFSLIYSEIYLIITFIYFILYCIYDYLCSTCTDKITHYLVYSKVYF